jgi:ATP-dependent HslUV protease ATP-binding subunit HslU
MSSSPLTPRDVVAALDRHIVGQSAAKRAVAVAVRNRWRRQQLPETLRKDVTPRNILLIGPTGVGKTEIARRLARLIAAPFVKVEATKFTEVGYVGRDVEAMIRDLADAAAALVRAEARERVADEAARRTEERLLDLLVPEPREDPFRALGPEEADRRRRTREKMRARLVAGELETSEVDVAVAVKPAGVPAIPGMPEGLGREFQEMMEAMMPKASRPRRMPVREARRVLQEQEADALIDKAALDARAVELTENHGIVFLDEIDKLCTPAGGQGGPDVSRQGVQRDLLPVVEGTTVGTRYGPVRTDHVLFIAAGAFHAARPADLMPELQGRFPVRVELDDLTQADYVRILTEPEVSLLRQSEALLGTEGVTLRFAADGVDAVAEAAWELNRLGPNTGARRLQTILERVLEEVGFDAPERRGQEVVIDAAYVRGRLEGVRPKDDAARFIL